MLRIDESSKTLVAPQAAAFVAEAPPARDELIALVSSGWDAFSAEIGQSHLRLLVAAPEPGVDVLAFDAASGRVAIIQVTDDPRSALTGALAAAAEVAGWDAQDLAEVHEALSAAVPGDSPKVLLVGAGWDEQTLATIDWLVRRHGLEIVAYQVGTLRFGAERLMQVSRAYPAADAPTAAPDPAAFFARVGSAAPPALGTSAPPPGIPA